MAAWTPSAAKQALDAELQAAGIPSAAAPTASNGTSSGSAAAYKTSQLWAVWTLFKRGLLNSWRNPAVIWLRFAMSVKGCVGWGGE